MNLPVVVRCLFLLVCWVSSPLAFALHGKCFWDSFVQLRHLHISSIVDNATAKLFDDQDYWLRTEDSWHIHRLQLLRVGLRTWLAFRPFEPSGFSDGLSSRDLRRDSPLGSAGSSLSAMVIRHIYRKIRRLVLLRASYQISPRWYLQAESG